MTCRLMGGSIQRRDRGYFLLGSSRPGLFCSNDLGCRYPGRYRIIELSTLRFDSIMYTPQACYHGSMIPDSDRQHTSNLQSDC